MNAFATVSRALPQPGGAALLLDFDGTLVDLAETPGGIAIDPGLPSLLDDLARATGGALALVSGRAIDDLAGFLPGYGGPLIGGHGAETRLDGRISRHPLAGSALLARLWSEVQALAAEAPGLLAEPKPTGCVLHYRRAPGHEAWVQDRLAALAGSAPGIEAHQSKMAVELRPDDIGKDRAVAALLQLPPFAGRAAIFCGDDATDEPAMAFCLQAGGTAIKVGKGPSAAPHRLDAPAALRAALTHWAGLETAR
ncbi:trehalose-phosphatase [Thetidibacter halocola]|uniref:Trehalose 6-phosphate phosphatase n=1 Tax=Thetidibacter halocola TaxID=2827239 RepID=A0A8J7WEX4_9RHOB|nr:trehalose-phosphatase [Thetidibacter halocola]MBS0126382.1 trehalose-phosphatase [Thetidibacter halocola]